MWSDARRSGRRGWRCRRWTDGEVSLGCFEPEALLFGIGVEALNPEGFSGAARGDGGVALEERGRLRERRGVFTVDRPAPSEPISDGIGVASPERGSTAAASPEALSEV